MTDDEYRAWIDAGSPNELEGWAIILALRARVAKLEAALTKIADNDPYSWEANIARAAFKDAPQ
jgi:hypothetical protein